jgi:dimethylargininase
MPTHAIVRRPSSRIAQGEVTHIERQPMDVNAAFGQHAGYVDLLRGFGLTIVEAPEADDFPDGLFVEDALVIVDDVAILTRPGALSRRGEVESMVGVIESLGLRSHRVSEPATLDGGDVIVTDRHMIIGLSTRSNCAAVEQCDSFVQPLGRRAIAAKVHGCLHLKSAITPLPDGSLIAVTDWVDVGQFEQLGYTVRPAAEHSGGDVLCFENTVVLPADAPRTAAELRAAGFEVITIDVSELQKIEAGVTCMSVLF